MLLLIRDCPKPLTDATGDDHHDKHEKPSALWSTLSIMALVGFLLLSIVLALNIPPIENDWLGLSQVIDVIPVITLGCMLSATFWLISLVAQEKHRIWAAFAGIPSLCWLLFLGSVLLSL